jgi:hypothetical protein
MNSPRSTLIGTHIAWSGEIDATGEIEAVAARARRALSRRHSLSARAESSRCACSHRQARDRLPRIGHTAIVADRPVTSAAMNRKACSAW